MPSLNILGPDPGRSPIEEAITLFAHGLEFRSRIITIATRLQKRFLAAPAIDAESDHLIITYLAELLAMARDEQVPIHAASAELSHLRKLLESGALNASSLLHPLTDWKSELFKILYSLHQLGTWTFNAQNRALKEKTENFTLDSERCTADAEQLKKLKELNERVLFLEILLKKSNSRATPPILVLDPTSHCNFRCRHCSQSVMQDYMHTYLSPETIAHLAPILPSVREAKLFGTGEATLSPFLPELIELTHAAGCMTEVQTNGSTLGKQAFNLEKVDHLGISFDGAEKRTFETLRVGANFSQLVEKIRSFRQRHPGTPIYFAVTVSRVNIDEIVGITALAVELGVEQVYLNKIIPYMDHLRPLALRRSDGVLLKAQLDASLALAKQHGISVTNCISLDHEIDDGEFRDKEALLLQLEKCPVLKPHQPHSIAKIIGWARQSKLRGYPKEIAPHFQTFEETFPLAARLPEVKETLDTLQHYHDQLVIELKEKPPEEIVIPYCTSPWVKCFVEAHSGIRPCDPWSSDIASLNSADSFAEAWNSPDLVNLRDATVAKAERPEKCRSCTFAEKHLRVDEILNLLRELEIDLTRIVMPDKFHSLKNLREDYTPPAAIVSSEPEPCAANDCNLSAEISESALKACQIAENPGWRTYQVSNATVFQPERGKVLLSAPQAGLIPTTPPEHPDRYCWISGMAIWIDVPARQPHLKAWMKAVLPLVRQAKDLFNGKELSWVFASPLDDLQRDILRSLDIEDHLLISFSDIPFLKTSSLVFFSKMTSHDPTVDNLNSLSFARASAVLSELTPPASNRRLFVRSSAQEASLPDDRKDIYQVLFKNLDFELIELENFSLAEQVSLFQNAGTIASFENIDSVHTLSCPSDSLIIEIPVAGTGANGQIELRHLPDPTYFRITGCWNDADSGAAAAERTRRFLTSTEAAELIRHHLNDHLPGAAPSQQRETPGDPTRTASREILLILKRSNKTRSGVLNGFPTYLTEVEIEYLLGLGRQLELGGTYVEIGHCKLLSTPPVALALQSSNNTSARVLCINRWVEELETSQGKDSFVEFLETIAKSGMDGLITPMRIEARKALSLFAEKSLDVVLIDMTGRTPPTIEDIRAWHERCREKGRLILYTNNQNQMEELAISLSVAVEGTLNVDCTPHGALWEVRLSSPTIC